jgi:hypothetical protein
MARATCPEAGSVDVAISYEALGHGYTCNPNLRAFAQAEDLLLVSNSRSRRPRVNGPRVSRAMFGRRDEATRPRG